MKKILVLTMLLFTVVLSGCDNENKDEFGVAYNPEETSIETALENDDTLSSVKITYHLYYYSETKEDISGTVIIDSNIIYEKETGLYIEKSTTNPVVGLRYEELEGEYIKYPSTYMGDVLTVTSEKFIQRKFRDSIGDGTNYTIEGNFYKFEATPYSDYVLLVRVNSKNFIDYARLYIMEDDVEKTIIEYRLEDHNNTTVELPEAEYYSEIDYAIRTASIEGFTINSIDKDNLAFSGEIYKGTIDLENLEITFERTVGSMNYPVGSTYTYRTYDDLYGLKLFVGEDLLYQGLLDILSAKSFEETGLFEEFE